MKNEQMTDPNTTFNCIVVLPYTETSRFFMASSSRDQEAYIGETNEVYYEYQAVRFNVKDACKVAANSGNPRAFVRQINS